MIDYSRRDFFGRARPPSKNSLGSNPTLFPTEIGTMTARFKDDAYRGPNFAIDGVIPRPPWESWSPQAFPAFPRGPDSSAPGYPWWVDPSIPPILPTPAPWPSQPPSPSLPEAPNSFAPAGEAAPAESAGLLGMLYQVMRQHDTHANVGFYSGPQETSWQALPFQAAVAQPVRESKGNLADEPWSSGAASSLPRSSRNSFNEGVVALRPPLVGLVSGKPMQYWGLHIFDRRR